MLIRQVLVCRAEDRKKNEQKCKDYEHKIKVRIRSQQQPVCQAGG